jgi:hypothetical protein
MLTHEQGFTPINVLTVYDVVVISQMIEKLLRAGLVTGRELNFVSSIRERLHTAVKQTIDYDIDNPPSEVNAEVENDG